MSVRAGADPRSNEIHFRTNLDEMVSLLTLRIPYYCVLLITQDLRPYIELRDGLLAKLSRPVYYQLAEYAEQGPDGQLGVWSDNQFFALEL